MSVLESIRDRIQSDDQDAPRTPTIDVDDAIDVLANERRRYILDVLARVDDEIDKGELAELVAAREYQTRIRHLTGQQRKRVYVALHQSTLPKLDGAGIIDYDDPVVEPTDRITVLTDAKQALNESLRGASA